MGSSLTYRGLSLWHETCGDDLNPRSSLPGDTEVDVAVVGAGFTGLWTAYYLSELDPSLRIAVLEAEIAGFGASGRNGGWMSALFPSSREHLAALPGSSREAAVRHMAAMRAAIDEAGRVIDKEGIDCDFHKGGTIVFARSAAQLRRARAEVEAARSWGDTDDDVRLLDPDEARAIAQAADVRGATYTPHCARIHPARLARGLARVVEARGVALYEQTPVTAIAPGLAETPMGRVRADRVIRATEGFTSSLRGSRRAVAPVYSLIVATEPLSESVWGEIGLSGRQTFADHRNLVIYGQRTEDGRLVFGGRGAPYHFSSRISPRFDRKERVFASLRETVTDLFPALAETAFTHEWGGPLGIARDWMASVGLDPDTGLGWAGGYVGDGVTTTNLAGRTLAHLVVGGDDDLTTLPWVNHRSRNWEPEPFRWLGINAGLRAAQFADLEESLTRRPSLVARAMGPLIGGSD
jgi:glycine/D-amino acid oxidase-like deaminating enzyme